MKTKVEQGNLVAKNWDPISRIIGNLGVYTKIDFGNRQVAECQVTSSLFRGYSVFLRGKDPRDAHFITSRICGICGDNHATCSVYAQNMAYGVKPPALAEWMINLGEAAEFIFDHTLFQDNLVFVDFCEQMVKETNPGLLEKAEQTAAPHAELHGFRTVADIMRAFNPFEGKMYKESLQMGRLTREMCCLMEGRHVHPSTLYPGGVGTVGSPQIFTDYLARLLKLLDFVKKAVPMNDDLFNFFYEALPGYEEVGRRRIQLACWGSFQDPEIADYRYATMNDWGRSMFVTPGVVVDGKIVTNDLVDINLGMRILLGSSFYGDWQGEAPFVTHDPLGNPVDQRHPWNQTTLPQPQKRNFDGGNYSWVMSPRWQDRKSGEQFSLGDRRRAAGPALGDRPLRPGRYPLRQGYRQLGAHHAPEERLLPGGRTRVEGAAVGQHHRARPRPHLLHRLLGGHGPVLHREGDGGNPRRPDQDLRGLRRCRRKGSGSASTRRCAGCSRTTW